MAGRYPDYDWRGIAMLTQQLGQLFEPSKAKLMSQQHEHEMGMLMAKQAWKTQTDQLDAARLEHKGLLAKLDAETEAVSALGLGELVKVGMRDGALPDQTSEVFEKTSLKNLSEMQETDTMYRKAIRELEINLSNMKLYNETAKVGKKFGTDYKGAKGAKNYLEIHDIEPETPGFLSPDERENVKFDALNTMFLVENVENLKEGTDYMTIHAAGKPVNVRPEALAFVAAFDRDKAEERREKAVKARAEYAKPGAKNERLMNQFLNIDASYMNLPQADKDLVAGALKNPELSKTLAPKLRDTYLAMKERDKLSVQLLQEEGFEERVQPLPDTVFEPVDAPGWFTGDVQNWTQYEEGGQIKPGLTKEMYDDIRKMGEKGSLVRRDFEFIVNNWDNLKEGQRTSGIQLVYSEYTKIKAEMLKEIQGL